ncbi:Na+/H+ antiporter subunit E [Methylonatrum kenyense]|uniref:Na+/H+ antiporter subunit E n=1 Tax=Methylonatrum kenyense TaxID=455253 RepID=UPI0020BE24CE|nr:Na+/H+ antiporter subunit E [Methylonatrum kenyense]MCK8517061.1 Na+/H+ antiporter subunit E [Methylonatrum kenyense]
MAERRNWALATGLFAFGFWWLLAGAYGLAYALVAALATGLLAAWLAPSRLPAMRLSGLLAFLRFFLSRSVLGGIDVSRRALQPDLPLDPGWLDYTCRLRTPPARNLFLLSISLMPGTLAADMNTDTVRVHLLDPAMRDDLPLLEQRISWVFPDEPELEP